ncbi:MAG TPA: amino acid adenylation domain-containing protein [Verrucomicrobiae bacterium]|nr:amino acid adenylation domain-containing protein [Verrucomicrobiae bacterium]
MQINVLEYFEAGALKRCAQKVAIIDHEHRYSFQEVERYAKNCADRILQSISRRNQPIAVLLPKGALTIFADLGILYSGNCYANLDVKSPRQRLAGILHNLGAQIIITDATHLPILRALEFPEEKILLIEQTMAHGVSYNNEALLARLDGVIDSDPLCIIHTSGSTGIPKGVALNHRSTIDFMDWVFDRLSLDGSEVIGSLSPFYFDIYTLELYLCLAKGATLVIVPEQYASFPVKLVEFLAAQSISFIFWVPTIMVNIANQDLLKNCRLNGLSKVFFAGEVFPTKHLNYWRKHLPGALFVNLYGPIEITVDCTYFIVDRDFGDNEKLPIGFPCRNTDILILNEQNQPTKSDEVGELCVRGTSLALGYWNNPERTAKAFVQNPLNSHYPELIYRTGDLVNRNSRGEIMFVGRKDFQIKHLGYRIELGEIEHAVLKITEIRNGCVTYDQAKKELILHFESDQPLSPGLIRERLLAYLPKYMLPTVYNRLEQLPRNPNGKIDRQRLTAS